VETVLRNYVTTVRARVSIVWWNLKEAGGKILIRGTNIIRRTFTGWGC